MLLLMAHDIVLVLLNCLVALGREGTCLHNVYITVLIPLPTPLPLHLSLSLPLPLPILLSLPLSLSFSLFHFFLLYPSPSLSPTVVSRDRRLLDLHVYTVYYVQWSDLLMMYTIILRTTVSCFFAYQDCYREFQLNLCKRMYFGNTVLE